MTHLAKVAVRYSSDLQLRDRWRQVAKRTPRSQAKGDRARPGGRGSCHHKEHPGKTVYEDPGESEDLRLPAPERRQTHFARQPNFPRHYSRNAPLARVQSFALMRNPAVQTAAMKGGARSQELRGGGLLMP